MKSTKQTLRQINQDCEKAIKGILSEIKCQLCRLPYHAVYQLNLCQSCYQLDYSFRRVQRQIKPFQERNEPAPAELIEKGIELLETIKYSEEHGAQFEKWASTSPTELDFKLALKYIADLKLPGISMAFTREYNFRHFTEPQRRILHFQFQSLIQEYQFRNRKRSIQNKLFREKMAAFKKK